MTKTSTKKYRPYDTHGDPVCIHFLLYTSDYTEAVLIARRLQIVKWFDNRTYRVMISFPVEKSNFYTKISRIGKSKDIHRYTEKKYQIKYLNRSNELQ